MHALSTASQTRTFLMLTPMFYVQILLRPQIAQTTTEMKRYLDYTNSRIVLKPENWVYS